ncbi:hypothetical protein [Streptomyces sp. NPDC093984]
MRHEVRRAPVAYAVEFGFDVAPIEAHARTQTGRNLDPADLTDNQ